MGNMEVSDRHEAKEAGDVVHVVLKPETLPTATLQEAAMVFFNLSFFHGSRMSLSAQSRPSALAMPFYAIDMPH